MIRLIVLAVINIRHISCVIVISFPHCTIVHLNYHARERAITIRYPSLAHRDPYKKTFSGRGNCGLRAGERRELTRHPGDDEMAR